MDRVLWAITYLRKSGLIESISWGIFQITNRGRSLLAENPTSLSSKDLERYPEYLEFKGGKSKNGGRIQELDTLANQESPEEELQRTFAMQFARA